MRLVVRLSLAVVVLAILTASAVVGVDAGFGRRGLRGITVVGIPLAVVAVLRLTARLITARRPGSPAPRWSPDALLFTALRRIRRLVRRWVARLSSAVHRLRRRARARRVELAALEAAQHDDRLSPENVRESAEALFRLVQLAWNARDSARLATLLGAELLIEWEGGLAESEHAGEQHGVEVLGDVQIDYVGLTRGGEGAGDAATVLLEARLAGYVKDRRARRIRFGDGLRDPHRLCQYWTLCIRDGLWTVTDIEERAQGKHHLADPIVASVPGGPEPAGSPH